MTGIVPRKACETMVCVNHENRFMLIKDAPGQHEPSMSSHALSMSIHSLHSLAFVVALDLTPRVLFHGLLGAFLLT